MRKRDALLLSGAALGTAAAVGTVGLTYAAWRLLSGSRYELRGKVALITGGSRGLGLELAREFARQGCRIAICARSSEELARAREDLLRRGAEVLAIACDLTDASQLTDMVNTVREFFGRIDILVNNAGVIQAGPLENMTLDDFEEAMKVHFWAPLRLSLTVLDEMQRRREGRIVNIASIGGKVAIPHLLPYDASKFALVGLSEGLRAELQRHGIAVVTICPGLMRTGSARNAFFKGQNRKEFAWFRLGSATPLSSMNATRAARQIVAATRRGRAEKILSVQANALAFLHGLFPGLVADVLGMVNRLLPSPGGIGTARAKGHESESLFTRSPLMTLDAAAARRNNEIAA